MKKIKNRIIVLVILFIILTIIVIYYSKNLKKIDNNANNNTVNNIVEESTLNQEDIIKVKSASMFFTVENCVYKYINYLSSKDKEIIYNLIDNKYKQEFAITKENVLDYVENLNGNYSFEANEISYIKNKEICTYFAKGVIYKEIMDTYSPGEEFNITVILDMQNMTFTVIPYGYGGIYYEK